MLNGISVLVCCYNSAARLPSTLQYLAKQHFEYFIPWEVIIINNNSTDNTSIIALSEWQKYNLPIRLRVIEESTPGLSAARERGIAESTYNCLIFCDDDNWLESTYLGRAFELMQAHPQIAVIGGNNIGTYEVPPPDWMNSFMHSYAIGEQGKGAFQILGWDGYIVGAGMVFKKDIYQEIKEKGFKFYLTDRIGNKVVGGGDIELCFIFKLAGYQVAYSSELKLQHFMPADRIQKSYLIKMWQQYSHSWLVFEAYKALLSKKGSKEILSEKYWKQVAYKRLLSNLSFSPRYIYHRLKKDVACFLPYEAGFIYEYFLLRNTGKLVNIIKELQEKVTAKPFSAENKIS